MAVLPALTTECYKFAGACRVRRRKAAVDIILRQRRENAPIPATVLTTDVSVCQLYQHGRQTGREMDSEF